MSRSLNKTNRVKVKYEYFGFSQDMAKKILDVGDQDLLELFNKTLLNKYNKRYTALGAEYHTLFLISKLKPAEYFYKYKRFATGCNDVCLYNAKINAYINISSHIHNEISVPVGNWSVRLNGDMMGVYTSTTSEMVKLSDVIRNTMDKEV